jgi:2-aminoethylphosphonate transport system substrate-binding protein
VIVTLPPFVQQAADTHLLEPTTLAADAHIPAGGRAADGAWRTFVDNYFCFGINPDVVKPKPTSFDDLLKPEFNDAVAYSNPATAGDGMAVIILTIAAFGGEDPAFAYLARLESSVKFHTRGTGYLDVLLSRREIKVANGDLQMDLGDAAGGGLSLEPVFLSAKAGEPAMTFSLPYAIGLVAHGPNQAEGRKLIEYLLSTDVQSKVGSVYGIPARDDVHAEGNNAEVVRKAISGVKVIPVDWTQVSEKKPAWLARFKEQVIGGSGKPTEAVAPKK